MSENMPLATKPNPNPRPTGSWGYLLRAVLAALIAWGFVQWQHPVFQVPADFTIGRNEPTEKIMAYNAHHAWAYQRNIMLYTGIIGGLLAAAMACGNLPCCSPAMRLSIAIPWGALAGAAAGYLGCVVQTWRDPETPPTLTHMLQVQVLSLGLLGVVLGMMFGAFTGSTRSVLTGTIVGAIAGVLAGMVYPMTTAIIVPDHNIESVVPEGAVVRLIWFGLFSGCIGVFVPHSVSPLPALPNAAVPQQT